MRGDMAQVLIERPRSGARLGYRRQRMHNRRVNLEDAPRREGISRRESHDSKYQRDLFGPLERFLRRNVGRPWDKVFAEICEHARLDNVAQQHLRRHVCDFVNLRVVEIDGKLISRSQWGGRGWPLRDNELYVCPRTGLLRVFHRKRGAVTRITARTRWAFDEQCHWRRFVTAQYHKIGRQWMFVEVRRVGTGSDQRYDAFLRRVLSEISEEERLATYDFDAWATAVRPVTRKEREEIQRRMRGERRKQ
jgi:hypothetical protein